MSWPSGTSAVRASTCCVALTVVEAPASSAATPPTAGCIGSGVADRSDGPPRHPTGHRLYKRARYRPAVDAVLDKFALVESATAPSTRREVIICPGVVPAMARNSRLRCA